LVEWKPELLVLESNYVEILEVCEEIEELEQLEVFGPQIELDPSKGPSIQNLGEPPVEVARMAPTVVVVEEEYSVEVLEASASVEMEMRDQAIGTGDESVLETVEKRIGAVLEDVEMGTWDVPVHDTGVGDCHFEDYPGDDFEKVGEFSL